MDRFMAILLQEYKDYPVGTIVGAMAGIEGESRWLVLRPVDLAGSLLVPLVDADRAITKKEAAHILGYRRGIGRDEHTSHVERYIKSGRLQPSGLAGKELGHYIGGRGSRFVSLRATWEMPFPEPRYRKPKQED